MTAATRRVGNPTGLRLLLSHGCGLASDTYRPFWQLFAGQYDLLLHDLPSHGRNPPLSVPPNIPLLVDDMGAAIERANALYGAKATIGVFHSISALTALLLQQREGPFAGLVLFDPPVCPPGKDPEDLEVICRRLAASAKRRRDHFPSREEFAESIASHPYYARLAPGVPELMSETLLRPATGGHGYELRCPREHEARLFEHTYGWAMQLDQTRVSCPVKTLAADPTKPPMAFMSGTDLDALIATGYDFLPDATHLLQLEEPGFCEGFTAEALATWGFL